MSKRGNESDTAPMEQVRELLFGAQFKDMETRFQRQEERFQREIADARDAMKKRLDSLENFMKSETASLLHRLKDEKAEGEAALKSEQRERAEGFKNEQHERAEALKTEQRERAEAIAQLAKDLATVEETFERRITKLSGTLDVAEQELRRLLLSESGSLSDKIEEKYQDALGVLARVAGEIRHDMVARSSLSGIFTEAAVKLTGQWPLEVNPSPMAEDDEEQPASPAKGSKARDSSGDA